MNITAINHKKESLQLEYVMTYVPGQPERSRKLQFPLSLDPLDAEGMLHALGTLSFRSEVKDILYHLYPSYRNTNDIVGILDSYTDEWGHIPIKWNKVDYYSQFSDAVDVYFGKRRFRFTDESSFFQIYKEAVHNYEDNGKYGIVINQHDFSDFATIDISEVLFPYTTIFLTAEDYAPVCKHLEHTCNLLQSYLKEDLFRFDDSVAPYEIYLVQLFREEADSYMDTTFYPDAKQLPLDCL